MRNSDNLITRIAELLFGTRYYANIVQRKDLVDRTSPIELSSYIFRTKREALRHSFRVEDSLTHRFIGTISFRSRKPLI